MGVLLYDGDCSFCTTTARWGQRHIISASRVEPWQLVDLDSLGVTEAEAAAAVQWVDGVHRSSGPDAIADYCRTSTVTWRLVGRLLARRPVRRVAWPVYDWVARHRGRLPGGTPACQLPRDQQPGR